MKLASLFGYDKVLFMNTGVEAGESAIKFARRWGYVVKKVEPNQATVLFAKGNFWGRTIAACASSDDPERYLNFGPFNGLNFGLVDYGSEASLEAELKRNKNIVAYMVEPIQGEKGVVVPPAGKSIEIQAISRELRIYARSTMCCSSATRFKLASVGLVNFYAPCMIRSAPTSSYSERPYQVASCPYPQSFATTSS
jgi:acetylornithine/succinyldiaminopimelate/putrescine aminotransferase